MLGWSEEGAGTKACVRGADSPSTPGEMLQPPGAGTQARRWAVPPCHAVPLGWHKAGFGWQTGTDPLLGRAVGAAGVDRGRGGDRNPMPAAPGSVAPAGARGEAELRSPPASTCPRAPKQRSHNKGALVSSTMPPFWPEHLPAGLEAAPGGSEGPFCVGMNGSLFPSGGLPPPARQAATLPAPGPQLHTSPPPPGRLGLLCLAPRGSGHPEMLRVGSPLPLSPSAK